MKKKRKLLPNRYTVVPQVTSDRLIDCGFVKVDNATFKNSVWLYQEYIKVKIYIFPDEQRMAANVVTADDCTYPAFYNEIQQHDNKVYDEVVRKYNHYMNSLVNKKILMIEEEK